MFFSSCLRYFFPRNLARPFSFTGTKASGLHSFPPPPLGSHIFKVQNPHSFFAEAPDSSLLLSKDTYAFIVNSHTDQFLCVDSHSVVQLSHSQGLTRSRWRLSVAVINHGAFLFLLLLNIYGIFSSIIYMFYFLCHLLLFLLSSRI